MSILDEAKLRVQENRLILLPPLLRGAHTRVCLVERGLNDEITNGALSADDQRVRIGQLRRDLDRFSSGKTITVGYGAEKSCLMKPLDPRTEEVWEIRSRDPSPSIRVFGRFAFTDIFVATHKAWRSDLGGYGDREWAREIRRCKEIWRQLFVHEPISGSDISTYISSDVFEVNRFP